VCVADLAEAENGSIGRDGAHGRARHRDVFERVEIVELPIGEVGRVREILEVLLVLVDDDTDEERHDEEPADDNKRNKIDCCIRRRVLTRSVVVVDAVHRQRQDLRPHLER